MARARSYTSSEATGGYEIERGDRTERSAAGSPLGLKKTLGGLACGMMLVTAGFAAVAELSNHWNYPIIGALVRFDVLVVGWLLLMVLCWEQAGCFRLAAGLSIVAAGVPVSLVYLSKRPDLWAFWVLIVIAIHVACGVLVLASSEWTPEEKALDIFHESW